MTDVARVVAEYRIRLSRHHDRPPGSRSEHFTLVVVMRDGREIARTYSNLYESFADAIASVRRQAREEARFLRSLRSVFRGGESCQP